MTGWGSTVFFLIESIPVSHKFAAEVLSHRQVRFLSDKVNRKTKAEVFLN
jgi:hypothetical protein